MSQRSELGDFLRARREALQPADVGLPELGRRRTPGLRREEVATLAGISIDYLVRLEQGRDTKPSIAVQAALSRALRLTYDERLHLAKLASGKEGCPAATPLRAEVAPNVRQLIDTMDTVPAFVIGPATHVLAWNALFESLVSPLGMLYGEEPNLARWIFFDPRARAAYDDWPAAAAEQVSRLRAAVPGWGDDPDFKGLVEELQQHRDFAAAWTEHHVAEKRRGTKTLRHPTLGRLDVSFEVLTVAGSDHQQLVTWLPANEQTRAAFRAATGSLATSPPQLRVVSD